MQNPPLPIQHTDRTLIFQKLAALLSVDGGRAFPCAVQEGDVQVVHSGMTYRQWLIGMALQGLLACDKAYEKAKGEATWIQTVARISIDVADEVGKALAPKPAPPANLDLTTAAT